MGLFDSRDVSNVLDTYERDLDATVGHLDGAGVDDPAIAPSLVDRFTIQVAQLLPDKQYIAHADETREGARVTIAVAFEGEGWTFFIRPRRYILKTVDGDVDDATAEVRYTVNGDREALVEHARGVLQYMEQNLQRLRDDLDSWNAHLEEHVRKVLAERRSKIAEYEATVGALGLPRGKPRATTEAAPTHGGSEE